MVFFKKKKGEGEGGEDLLEKLERETASLEAGPAPRPRALPPPPGGAVPRALPPRPVPVAAKPMVSVHAPVVKEGPKPQLTTRQVAKLPLFMKVDEYDRIVSELNTLVNSLKNMEEIMEKMMGLEHEESEETKRWQEQLDITKEQVRLLLAEMPETGKLQRVLREKKKAVKTEETKKKVEELKKQLTAPVKKEVDTHIQNDIGELRDSIKALHDEMKHMHLEFKMLSSLTQLKSSKVMQGIKEGAKASPKPKPTVKSSPWGK